jgi:hypothetical protein
MSDNTLDKKPNPIKKFWAAKKTPILATTTVISVTLVAVMLRSTKQHNDFLTEKGLFNEFYALDEDGNMLE